MSKALTINVGSAQYNRTLLELVPQIADVRPGVKLILTKISDDQTDQQRKGFHWLLKQWQLLRPGEVHFERLKSNLLTSMFGAARMIDETGNEHYIPLRRTTQIWDWDTHCYKNKKLSRSLYTDLIEHVYRMAAEDGSQLPEMSLEHLKELDREIGWTRPGS